MSYKIVRMYYYEGVPSLVIKRGVTLEQAQEHCRNPESSSSTCKSAEGKLLTKRSGPWFDSYTKERLK
jgi:hypothetical protein